MQYKEKLLDLIFDDNNDALFDWIVALLRIFYSIYQIRDSLSFSFY
jgi:hypothetical protein